MIHCEPGDHFRTRVFGIRVWNDRFTLQWLPRYAQLYWKLWERLGPRWSPHIGQDISRMPRYVIQLAYRLNKVRSIVEHILKKVASEAVDVDLLREGNRGIFVSQQVRVLVNGREYLLVVYSTGTTHITHWANESIVEVRA